jgi:RHS repeat-associated protein
VTELVAGTVTTNRSEGYAGGRHLVTQNFGTTYFIHTDWLGTERARTTLTGSSAETCTSLAYGDSLTCTGTDVSPLHFTGKMHDTETGLDDFPARYYSSTQGRWYSPDWASAQVPVPYADLHNPQTLNLYDYVSSDPTNHADADGHAQTADSGIKLLRWWEDDLNAWDSSWKRVYHDLGWSNQANREKWAPPSVTVTIIVTTDEVLGIQYGSHTAIYLSNSPDGAVIYDPSGSYKNATRGSGGILSQDEGASLSDYIKYQQSTGSKVSTYTFEVSASDQKTIYDRAVAIGDPRGTQCARAVTAAIQGVGPFKSVTSTRWPGAVANQMQQTQTAIAIEKLRQWVVKTIF